MYNTEIDKTVFGKLFKNLIVIEGSDGSGKATQSSFLVDTFDKMIGVDARLLDFPDYPSETGKVISTMLSGKYGEDAGELNPFFTSPMYSIDRYQYIKRISDNSRIRQKLIGVCNRYTMSNLIHQGARLSNSDLISYWNWLYDFEFNKLGLPMPSIVIYLYVPYQVSRDNVIKRAQENNLEIDINEKEEYLALVDQNVNRLRGLVDWKFIDCMGPNGSMKTIDEIHKEIVSTIVNAHIPDISQLLFNE